MIKVKVAIKEAAAVNYTFEDGYPEKTFTIGKLSKKILPYTLDVDRILADILPLRCTHCCL